MSSDRAITELSSDVIDDGVDVSPSEAFSRDEAEPDTSPVSYTGTDFDVEGLASRFHEAPS